MSAVLQPVSERHRRQAAVALQNLLPHLVALNLDAKQIDWNLARDEYPVLAGLAREVAVDARSWADRIATRAVALGLRIDVRPGAFAAIAASIRKFPAGAGLSSPSEQGGAARGLAEVVDRVLAVSRIAADQIGDGDDVARQLVTDLQDDLASRRQALRSLA